MVFVIGKLFHEFYQNEALKSGLPVSIEVPYNVEIDGIKFHALIDMQVGNFNVELKFTTMKTAFIFPHEKLQAYFYSRITKKPTVLYKVSVTSGHKKIKLIDVNDPVLESELMERMRVYKLARDDDITLDAIRLNVNPVKCKKCSSRDYCPFFQEIMKRREKNGQDVGN